MQVLQPSALAGRWILLPLKAFLQVTGDHQMEYLSKFTSDSERIFVLYHGSKDGIELS